MTVVHSEKTPNEHCLKFFTGIEMLKKVSSLEFDCASKSSLISTELFSKVQGIENIMITKEFLSITKSETSKWEVLKPQIFKLLICFKKEQKPFVDQELDVEENSLGDGNSPEVIICEILKDKLREGLLLDGADIGLVGLDGKDLKLELKGSFKDFPESYDSLENTLRTNLSEWVEVDNYLFI